MHTEKLLLAAWLCDSDTRSNQELFKTQLDLASKQGRDTTGAALQDYADQKFNLIYKKQHIHIKTASSSVLLKPLLCSTAQKGQSGRTELTPGCGSIGSRCDTPTGRFRVIASCYIIA